MIDLLEKVYNQENLTKNQMKGVAQALFSGQLSEAQIGALLLSLKIKGETSAEMAGIAELLREIAVPIPVSSDNTICNCGTGGDRSNSFNISTTSAFVLAAAGLKVAKTGNRSISSKAGSFDTCEALGINFLLPTESLASLLDEVNIAFIFAPHVHPKMRYVMPARQSLATPTIMNLIGPLTNPILLDYQLMGIYRRDLLVETAETLQKLGRKRAVVVNGADHMDEASLAGENHYALLANDQITMHSFTPEEVGLPRYSLAEIAGGSPVQNAKILVSVLKGEPGPYFDTTLLNAGLGLYAGEKVATLEEGISLARELLQKGLGYAKLQQLLNAQKKYG